MERRPLPNGKPWPAKVLLRDAKREAKLAARAEEKARKDPDVLLARIADLEEKVEKLEKK